MFANIEFHVPEHGVPPTGSRYGFVSLNMTGIFMFANMIFWGGWGLITDHVREHQFFFMYRNINRKHGQSPGWASTWHGHCAANGGRSRYECR